MTAATVQNVRDYFPQFESTAEYSETRVQSALDRAALEIIQYVDDPLYTEGHALLAAHKLALGAIAAQSQGSNTGGVAGINIPGQASIQFAQNPTTRLGADSGYGSTRYGVDFLEWMKKVSVGIRIY